MLSKAGDPELCGKQMLDHWEAANPLSISCSWVVPKLTQAKNAEPRGKKKKKKSVEMADHAVTDRLKNTHLEARSAFDPPRLLSTTVGSCPLMTFHWWPLHDRTSMWACVTCQHRSVVGLQMSCPHFFWINLAVCYISLLHFQLLPETEIVFDSFLREPRSAIFTEREAGKVMEVVV